MKNTQVYDSFSGFWEILWDLIHSGLVGKRRRTDTYLSEDNWREIWVNWLSKYNFEKKISSTLINYTLVSFLSFVIVFGLPLLFIEIPKKKPIILKILSTLLFFYAFQNFISKDLTQSSLIRFIVCSGNIGRHPRLTGCKLTRIILVLASPVICTVHLWYFQHARYHWNFHL